MDERWIVVGGGIKGMVAAYLLAENDRDVVLLEASDGLGGVLRSVEWNGFVLDKGCHLFGNTDPEATRILLDLAGRDVVPVEVTYASVLDGVKTDGFAVPDLTSLPDEVAAGSLVELLRQAAEPSKDPSNLEEAMVDRFGRQATRHLSPAIKKAYQLPPGEIDAPFLDRTPFSRVRVADSPTTTLLKGLPELDRRVAASSAEDPFRFYPDAKEVFPHRNFYPAKRGLLGFCNSAEEVLKARGVKVDKSWEPEGLDLGAGEPVITSTNGDQLVADHIFWAAGLEALTSVIGLENDLAALTHPVSMVVYYFTIPEDQVGRYTYLHDFDPDHLIFRASTPGTYGPQTAPDGLSYICCEVPTQIGSERWEDPEGAAERVWAEARSLGAVRCSEPIDQLAVPVAETYETPRQGYQPEVERVLERLPATAALVVPPDGGFSKVQIIQLVQAALGVE